MPDEQLNFVPDDLPDLRVSHLSKKERAEHHAEIKWKKRRQAERDFRESEKAHYMMMHKHREEQERLRKEQIIEKKVEAWKRGEPKSVQEVPEVRSSRGPHKMPGVSSEKFATIERINRLERDMADFRSRYYGPGASYNSYGYRKYL